MFSQNFARKVTAIFFDLKKNVKKFAQIKNFT